MILNVKATPPTPPARQQANRLQLAEDLRSGRYRQEKTSFQSSDGSRVCLLGAAYETARRVQAYGQTMPTLENALANERRFQRRQHATEIVAVDAYGFTNRQQAKLMFKNLIGFSFEQLADDILKMPPAGSVAPPGPATRLRNRLTRLWHYARAGLESALRRPVKQPVPAPVPMPVDATTRRRDDLAERTLAIGDRNAPLPATARVR